jgi:membrane protein DedA with SNARE-associated domain
MDVSYETLLSWILSHGYLFMFSAMLIGGTISTAASGFALALGYFNPLIVYAISVVADIISDVIQYSIGYWGRTQVVERYGHRLGFSRETIDNIEAKLQRHAVRALATMKTMPAISTFALLAAGGIRMPFPTFFYVTTLVIIPKSFIYMMLGYYLGTTYTVASQYMNRGVVILVMAIILIVLSKYVWKKTEIFLQKLNT